MIAAALVLLAPAGQAAAAQPAELSVGPFVVSSEVTEPAGAPYPVSYRLTHLGWRSHDGLVSYDLTDSGETVSIDYEVGTEPRKCLGRAGPYRLTRKPAHMFGDELFLTAGCAQVLSAAQTLALRREFRAVAADFRKAYAAFHARTLQQHGASRRRCRELGAGYHGLICQRYWDEDEPAKVKPTDKPIVGALRGKPGVGFVSWATCDIPPGGVAVTHRPLVGRFAGMLET